MAREISVLAENRAAEHGSRLGVPRICLVFVLLDLLLLLHDGLFARARLKN